MQLPFSLRMRRPLLAQNDNLSPEPSWGTSLAGLAEDAARAWREEGAFPVEEGGMPAVIVPRTKLWRR